MREIRISPSILNADFADLGKVAEELEQAGADAIHLDVMDGHFVRNITFGPAAVGAIRRHTSLPLEVHLMIERPDLYVEQFGDAGSDMLIMHRESSCDIGETLDSIRKNGMKTGLALNPDSEARSGFRFLPKTDMLLIMSVYPGFGGQKFIRKSLAKIKSCREYIRERGLKTIIGVDGGIDHENAGSVIEAGAVEIAPGTAIISSGNIKKAIRELRDL